MIQPNLRQLLDMRRSESHKELFEVRGQMADWMIEVLTHFNKEKGSNEYTYFKALMFLDMLIAKGQVTVETMHIYGIACMYLASNLLDTLGIDLHNAYENIGHKAFDANRLLRYINRAIEGLAFNFRVPTWIEYLDKVLFDTFGDYRDNLAEFNIRQTAIFVLHACAFDVQFYGWDPFKLAVTALMYSINSFFNQYEESCKKRKENVELLRAQSSKENIVTHLLLHAGMNRTNALQNLVAFNEYLANLMYKVRDSTYAQLKGLFKYAE